MSEFEHLQNRERVMPGRRPTGKPAPNEAHDVLRLQRLAGNSAVSGLIAQRQDDGGVSTDGGDGGGGGGGGTVVVSATALKKPAIITIDQTNGRVTDASATIGDTGG